MFSSVIDIFMNKKLCGDLRRLPQWWIIRTISKSLPISYRGEMTIKFSR